MSKNHRIITSKKVKKSYNNQFLIEYIQKISIFIHLIKGATYKFLISYSKWSSNYKKDKKTERFLRSVFMVLYISILL